METHQKTLDSYIRSKKRPTIEDELLHKKGLSNAIAVEVNKPSRKLSFDDSLQQTFKKQKVSKSGFFIVSIHNGTHSFMPRCIRCLIKLHFGNFRRIRCQKNSSIKNGKFWVFWLIIKECKSFKVICLLKTAIKTKLCDLLDKSLVISCKNDMFVIKQLQFNVYNNTLFWLLIKTVCLVPCYLYFFK